MIPLLLLLSRVQVLNAKTLSNTMKRKPHGLVLITSKNPHCQPCRRLETLFENISVTFKDQIQFGILDAETSNDLVSSFSVSILPSIVLFTKGSPIRVLDISTSSENINKFCASLISPPITEINSLFEFYNFSSVAPSNIIIYDPSKSGVLKAASRAISDYGIESNIGIIKNSSLTNMIGFTKSESFVQINLPFEDFSINKTDFSTSEFLKYAHSNIIFLENSEVFGMCPPFEHTIIFLYDENDPYHQYQIARLHNHIIETFGKKFAFQICDKIKCLSSSQSFGAFDVPWPLMILSTNSMGKSQIEPYQTKSLEFDAVDRWINFAAFGIQSQEDILAEMPEDDQIPILMGTQFQKLALDPKYDVLIFVASPRMKLYRDSREQFKKLMKVFGLIKGVKFYEFNPVTQHVMGLQIPKSDNPQISIWPAQKEPNGGTLPANVKLELIVENVLPILKSPINQDTIIKMQAKLQEVTKEL
ncbi:hypothetical protein M9Y10_044884 [Tritrichomonas musculus]|uniref:Thioredoxin domain-containing protein n=1 Tax=Tritrichomonas musculus TaxID=1915356 RepID=A0ABR2JVH1_9EUKA